MLNNIPSHVAVIMDGNARWAQNNNLSKEKGYEKGIESLNNLIKSCIKYNINFLTVYALSTENVKRQDINILYSLIRKVIKEINLKDYKDIKFKLIGNRSNIDSDILNFFENLEKENINKKKIKLKVAYIYGSWDEILVCFIRILKNYKFSSKNKKITKEIIAKNLYTYDSPNPDILIRTGGNKRLSNFLLLQLKYTELFFTDILWPDFNENNLLEILKDFNNRKRTYGL